MNSKGTSVLMIIFELLVVVMIVGGSMQIANKIAKDETTTQTAITNEIRMMLETLVAVPGNIVVQVPFNTSKYTVEVTNQKVTLDNKGNVIFRKFHVPETYIISGIKKNVETLCLEKKDGKFIFLRECVAGEING